MPRPVHTGNAPPGCRQTGRRYVPARRRDRQTPPRCRGCPDRSAPRRGSPRRCICPRGPYRGSAADKHAGRHRRLYCPDAQSHPKARIPCVSPAAGAVAGPAGGHTGMRRSPSPAGRCKDHNARPAAGNQDPDPARQRAPAPGSVMREPAAWRVFRYRL